MQTQTSFAELEVISKKKQTRRERFLAQIEAATPWAQLVAVIEPHDPKGDRGRPDATTHQAPSPARREEPHGRDL
jgi:DNA topoisomerase VI subunit B